MRQSVIQALVVISIFLLAVWVVYNSLSSENPTKTPVTHLSYDYIGYAFIEANTTLEFHGILMEEEFGPGFSISVSGIPQEIRQKTEIKDIPCPNKLKGYRCRDVTLLLTPTLPGSYDLSEVTITVTSNSQSISSKLGMVKLEVINNTFENLKPVYYPYAGTYLRGNITPNITFYYYTVFKNTGNESIRITGAEANSSLIALLGLYYQEIPPDVPPQNLDIPDINRAKAVPPGGLEVKPENSVAIITPIRIKTPAENAIISLKFEASRHNSEKSLEVPGIPYYILGGG